MICATIVENSYTPTVGIKTYLLIYPDTTAKTMYSVIIVDNNIVILVSTMIYTYCLSHCIQT